MSKDLEYVIDTGLSWPYGRVERKVTDHIQIHHTVGRYGTPERWKALHAKKISEGNKGVGYSYLILRDGSIYLGRGHQYAHGGVKDSLTNNANQRSISIAFDGDMRDAGLPTEYQLQAAYRLIHDLMDIYGLPISAVIGHNEVPTYANGKPTGKGYATLCPCIDMDAFRAYLADNAGAVINDQSDTEKEDYEPIFPRYAMYGGSTYVNLRDAPVNGSIIGRVSREDMVIALGSYGGWLDVVTQTLPLQRGYCLDRYFTEG